MFAILAFGLIIAAPAFGGQPATTPRFSDPATEEPQDGAAHQAGLAKTVADVVRRVQSSPDLPEYTVSLLEDLLPTVEGTPYEDFVLRLLERERERDMYKETPEGSVDTEQQEEETIQKPTASGLGFRAGFGDYLYSTDHPLYLRPSLGLYYYFAESEASRVEGGLDFAPSRSDPSRNHYLLLRLDYVKYSPGSFYLAAGGGLIFEELYGDDGTFGCVDVAVGNRLSLGGSRLDVRLGLQVPVGQDLNAPWFLSLALAYDL